MSQKTITSYFNNRKRRANDELSTKSYNKRPCVDQKPIVKDLTDHQLIESSPKHIQNEILAKPETELNRVKNDDLNVNSTEVRGNLNRRELRKKLAGSSKLEEIKARADRLSKGIQELKAANAKRSDVEKSSDAVFAFNALNKIPNDDSTKSAASKLRTLSKDRQKLNLSPVRNVANLPAYIRHATLATSSPGLLLPFMHRTLAELFKGMETVIALLYNRNEKITFNKLKPSLQEMMKRNFTEKHLAQIKHLVPDFYTFEIQKTKNLVTSQKVTYELVISPNFPKHIKIMNPTVLLERRRYFDDTLLQIVKKHHDAFLISLDPPMVIPDDKLTRWHPEFEIEKVPEIDCAKLPQMPNVEKVSSAQDVLAKARELFKCNTKMERALLNLSQNKEKLFSGDGKFSIVSNDSQSARSNSLSDSINSVKIINPALKKLPASLLEKVKEKQAAKALAAMTRSAQSDNQYLSYSRLPELARTIRNIYVTERKNMLPLNLVLAKLGHSLKSRISTNDLHKDVLALVDKMPELVKLSDIRKVTYLKFDKNIDLKNVAIKFMSLAEKSKLQ